MQEELSHVGSSCGCDGQTARDSFRVPPSPGRLKAAWQSRGSGGGSRRAGRRHRVMAEMREGESRYFISGKRKREER